MSTEDVRDRIAARAALELAPGELVNLGIGIPNRIPAFLPPDSGIHLQTENGLLGVGPRPVGSFPFNPDLIDAAKLPITAIPGAACFDSADSFAMIRGGHVDVAVLGALQVGADGDLANWSAPGRTVLGVGGAMDLAAGARRVIVAMTALDRDGEPKLLETCDYPLTAAGVVDTIVTENAVFRRREGKLSLVELLGDASIDRVRAETGARFEVAFAGAS